MVKQHNSNTATQQQQQQHSNSNKPIYIKIIINERRYMLK